MLAWMGYALLAAGALGVMASLIDFAGAGRFRRRRVVWAGAFLASAVGPIVFSVNRGIPTAVVAEADVRAAPGPSGWREAPIVSDRVLGSAWLAASAAFALWLVAHQRRLRRRLRGYPSRIVDGERVLVSPDFGPAVVGVIRPQIVLPGWALAIGESDRRVIVAHETEHRQAHDPLLAAVALIAVVALPWNTALWWQLRRLRLAIEIDCDRRVVSRHGHDPHAYGMLLLATRGRASRATPARGLAMAAMRSGLGRRVEALVGGRPRSAVRRLSAVAAAVVLAAGIVSVPAPRLSMVRAALVDASAAAAPLANSPTPAAPPRPRQASTPPDASDDTPSRSAAVSPSLPPPELMTRLDSLLTQNRRILPPGEATTVRALVPSGVPNRIRMISLPGAEPRWVSLPSGAPNRIRMVLPRSAEPRWVPRSSGAPNRGISLPIRDSLHLPPP